MATQPTITNSDTSELQTFNGIFRDRVVTVGAGDTLAKYTVLGIENVTNNFVLFASAAVDGSNTPRTILMQEIVNATGGALDYTVQVMTGGEFDGSNVVFDNGTDTLVTDIAGLGVNVEDAMKTEGLTNTFRQIEDELDNQ